jgi:hypothetical protein
MNDKPKTEKIDIYGAELEQELPHWLSPAVRDSDKRAAERKRRHQQYQAEERAKRKPKK